MKKSIVFLFLFLFIFMTENVFSQTPQKKIVYKNHMMNDMPDNKDMNNRLVASLVTKVPETGDIIVDWVKTSEGYTSYYTISNIPRMSLFDASGKFIQTFLQSSWDERAPENIKLEHGQGQYNVFDVINFWESEGNTNKRYYLEMQERSTGNSKNIWSDDNGKFSETLTRV
ncbi:MAG: hypothetical protein HOP08_14925 [Cyclobacteriaceae bacterium]|nr:hypothetical protein [Cyclobacteriaceae bacterium]